jgi:hypothetical protein
VAVPRQFKCVGGPLDGLVLDENKHPLGPTEKFALYAGVMMLAYLT